MQVEKREKYTFISSDETSLQKFQEVFFKELDRFQQMHLVLHISESINIDTKDFLLFLSVAENKQQNGTSFVVINSNINADDFPENLNIVPTLQEAEDILEMEAIERELGF